MLKYVCEFRNRLVTFSSADGFVLSCNWSVRTLSLVMRKASVGTWAETEMHH